MSGGKKKKKKENANNLKYSKDRYQIQKREQKSKKNFKNLKSRARAVGVVVNKGENEKEGGKERKWEK